MKTFADRERARQAADPRLTPKERQARDAARHARKERRRAHTLEIVVAQRKREWDDLQRLNADLQLGRVKKADEAPPAPDACVTCKGSGRILATRKKAALLAIKTWFPLACPRCRPDESPVTVDGKWKPKAKPTDTPAPTETVSTGATR